MCPDAELLSAFADGEVPSPWKERLSLHLDSCPACAARLASFGALRQRLHAGPEPKADELVQRLLSRLDARPRPETAASPRPPLEPLPHHRPALWARSVSLPLPAVAAAAAVLVFFAGVAVSGLFRPSPARALPSLASADIPPAIAQGSSMEALVRYLEAQNAQVNLTIQLPSTATFDASGSPLIVTAPPSSLTPYPLPSGEDAPVFGREGTSDPVPDASQEGGAQ